MSNDISQLLKEWMAGNALAGSEVVARTYDELRRIARAQLRHERQGHTLQTTALLNEAYLRVLRHGPGSADTRDAFFRLMSAEMRRRLIDHARRRHAEKRGGGSIHQPVDTSIAVPAAEPGDDEALLRRLDQAIAKLNDVFPRAARIVELRYMVELTTEETAAQLGLSVGTVKRDWRFARAWLASAIEADRL